MKDIPHYLRFAFVALTVSLVHASRISAQSAPGTMGSRIDSLLAAGAWASAVADLDRVLLSAPSAVAYAQRGRAQRERGNLVKSRADYDAAIALDSTYGAAYAGRAATRLIVGDPEGVLDDVQRARRHGLMAPTLFLLEGMANGRRQNDSAAVVSLTRYVELVPADPNGWYYRGFSLGRTGRHQDAVADLSRAIDLKMTGYKVYRYRAISNLALDRVGEACADGAEAAKRGDNDAGQLVTTYCRKNPE